MKNRIYTVMILMGLTFSTVSFAQKKDKSEVKITKVNSFEYSDDSVHLDLDLDLSDLKMRSRRAVVLEPRISKSQQAESLPTVVVRGRNNAKSYRRVHKLENQKKIQEFKELYNNPQEIVDRYGKNSKTNSVNYVYSMPYEPWMLDSEVFLNCTGNSCGKSYPLAVDRPNEHLRINIPTIEEYIPNPLVSLIKPEPVAVKRRDIQYSSALTFKVNSSVIDPNLANNRHELNSIQEMMESVLADDDFTITAVNIIGYASPEGTLKSNQLLSERRAKALENILKNKYDIPSNLYNVEFGGENWKDLVPMVESLSLSDKDQILDIIQNVSIENGRESKLMHLNGGESYRYLLKNCFPSLRVVIVDVQYNIDAYDLVRIKELIDVKPENLSLEEMYRLSETYEVESTDFSKVFITAVKLYPNDEVALHNALASAILAHDIQGAQEYALKLDERSTSPEVLNTLGAYYLMVNDFEKAESLLHKAQLLGSSNASENLKQLAQKIENAAQVEENRVLKAKVLGGEQ